MKKNLLTKILTLSLIALFSLSCYAQQKIYLVKDNKIVATYGTDEVDYMTFDPEGLSNGDFNITIDEVDYRYVVWTVTPEDPDMYYYTGVYTWESIADRYHNSVEEMASALYHDMSFLAGMVGWDPDQFMESSVLYKGEAEVGYDQLGAGSDYVIVAFGCNPDGTATTSSYTTLDFSTPKMPMTGLKVDFSITAETNDVQIDYTPSDPSILYFTEVREYDGENDLDLQDWLNTLIWRGGVIGMSPEEVVEKNAFMGNVTQTYSLEPNTTYKVYACSVTEDGVVNSEVSSMSFVTGPVAPSENTFKLTVNWTGPNKANLSVNPSNDDYYSVGVLPLSAFEGKTDEEVLAAYVENNIFSVDWNTRSGEYDIDWNGLDPETEYAFFAFGYYHYTITTGMTKVTFKTEPASDPKTWEASFGAIQYGTYYGSPAARTMITVNHDDVLYLWNVVDASGTPDQIHEALVRECDRAEGKGFNYVEMYGIYGSNEVTFTPDDLDPEAEYKFFAVVMNPETREFETEVFFSDTFTMQQAPALIEGLKQAPAQVEGQEDSEAKRPVIKGILEL